MHDLDRMQPELGQELYREFRPRLGRPRRPYAAPGRYAAGWPYGYPDGAAFGLEPWEPEVDLLGWARSLFGSTLGAAEAAAAVAAGERNEGRLTDILFYARHPERRGRRIQPGETQPAQEWTRIRDTIVRPVLRTLTTVGPSAPAAPAGPAGPPAPVPFVELARRLLAAAWNYRALGVTLSPDQVRRIPCMLTKLLDPRTDDRAVLIGVTSYTVGQMATQHLSPDDWKLVLSPLRREITDFFGNIANHLSNADLLLRFRQFYDEQIARNMGQLKLLELPLGGGSGVPPGIVDIHDWVSRQQDNPQSIYSCYT